MASPNTIKRNEELKDLKPTMIPYKVGEVNEQKHIQRIIKGMHKGNTYGKRNYKTTLEKRNG